MTEKKLISCSLSQLPYSQKADFLAASACPGFFPADVIRHERKIQIIYSVEGFRRLRDLRNLSASQSLRIFQKTVQNIQLCRDWLSFPEEYVLSVDSVWQDDHGKVKFLYIPDTGSMPERKRLLGYLQGMKSLTDQVGVRMLELLQERISADHLTPQQLTAFADEMLMDTQAYSVFSYIK